MSKFLAASKELMKNYLSELLTEDELKEQPFVAITTEKVAEKNKLEKLLQQVSVTQQHDETAPDVITSQKSENMSVEKVSVKAPVIETEVIPPTILKQEIESVIEQQIKTKKSAGEIVLKTERNYRKGSFQAMFFDVAGLIIAVPLIELGGIHNVEKTTSMIGKPDWFKGVMLHREEKINVVDTALWVMPEKCDKALKDSLNYQYIIMLSNSQWGLSAENLVDTVTLNPEDVKWLDSPSKRPWLAGLVKERMCALLDVEALIQLLNDGMDITNN